MSYASRTEDWENLSEDQWYERLTEHPIFVAFQNNTPCGIMGLMPHRPSKLAHRATITMVYVCPKMRDLGIGQALFQHLYDHAVSANIEQLELGVNAENQGAIRFYKRNNFIEIGRIPNAYKHDFYESDEILMARRTCD